MNFKLNKNLKLIGQVIAFTCISHHAQSITFFVNSSDALLAALTEATAGDTIEIAPGTYVTDSTAGEFSTADGDTAWRRWFFRGEADGTADAPITLKSQDSNDPAILSGTGWSDSGYGLYITGNHWIVENLIVTEAAKGILIANSDYSQITNVEIYSIGQEGVHILDGSDYTTIDGINIHDVGIKNDGYGEGIYVGSDNGVWWEGDGVNTGENGLYYHRDVVGTHIKNSTIGPNITAEPFDIKEGAAGTIVENNIIYATGISGQNYADSHIDIKGYETIIKNNTFYQNDNTGVLRSIMIVPRISAGVNAQYTAHDNYVHNNTFYLNEEVEVLVANSGSENIYAWDNTRDPADGNYYNSNVIESIPGGYYDDVVYYALSASAGDNGNINPSGSIEVESGESQTFTISPDTGYLIDEVLVNGVSVGTVSSYSFTEVSSDQSITASFIEDSDFEYTYYELTAMAGDNGNISPSGSFSLQEGSEQNFSITADDGYQVADVIINSVSMGAIDSYTVSNLDGDFTINVSFEETPIIETDITATLTMKSQWASGYCAEVELTNNGDIDVLSWQVTLDLDGTTIKNLWSGDETDGVVVGKSYNEEITTDSSVSFGFCGNAENDSVTPSVADLTVTLDS